VPTALTAPLGSDSSFTVGFATTTNGLRNNPDCRSWWLVVGFTHPVPDNTITTHCDAVPNHQPLTTNHVFGDKKKHGTGAPFRVVAEKYASV
jgi:hypothetical protein